MNSNGSKLQAWLTPALQSVGLGLLLLIWSEVKDMESKLDVALIRLGKHQTVLEVYGLLPSARASQPPTRRTPWTEP